VAVRCEVEAPPEGRPSEGRLTVTVELPEGGAMDRHSADQAEAHLAAALASSFATPRVAQGCCRGEAVGGDALDWAALGILPARRAWRLGCDCLVLSDDGALLDALSLALKAALADCTLPELEIVGGGGAGAGEGQTDCDFELGHALRRLDTSRVPIIVTVSRVRAAEPARL